MIKFLIFLLDLEGEVKRESRIRKLFGGGKKKAPPPKKVTYEDITTIDSDKKVDRTIAKYKKAIKPYEEKLATIEQEAQQPSTFREKAKEQIKRFPKKVVNAVDQYMLPASAAISNYKSKRIVKKDKDVPIAWVENGKFKAIEDWRCVISI